MRGLKICLWIAAVGCLLSVIGLFLPLSAWESVAGWFGIQLTLPDSPLFEYAARLLFVTYTAVGVFFAILALAPMKYGVMVPFSGLSAIIVGAICAITGLIVRMPILWFLGDSVSCLVIGILILVFWQKAKQTS